MDCGAFFEGSEKLTSVFGYWPSFHDAEVHEFALDRGDVYPDWANDVYPVLTLKVHVFEMTNQVNPAGYFVLQKHTLATLRFHEIEEFRADGFNFQNAISGLGVSEAGPGSRGLPMRAVSIDRASGLDAFFKCSRCEVVEALPCDENGRLHA